MRLPHEVLLNRRRINAGTSRAAGGLLTGMVGRTSCCRPSDYALRAQKSAPALNPYHTEAHR